MNENRSDLRRLANTASSLTSRSHPIASGDFLGLVRAWLSVHLSRARRLSPHTIRSYKTALTTLLDYLIEARRIGLAEITFDALDHATIAELTLWLAETRHLAPSSANQRLAAIKSFLGYCASEDPTLVTIWLDVKQARPMRTPTPIPEALSMPAVDALIRAPRQHTPRSVRDSTSILVIVDTAARTQKLSTSHPPTSRPPQVTGR